MKIHIDITVDLDPKDWTLTFGESGAADIRQAVKEYIGGEVQQVGAFGNGEIPATITWK